MIATWKRYLLDHAAAWELPHGNGWNFVVHNNYHPQSSNLNVLWFSDSPRFPRVVVKFSADSVRLEKEFQNLVRAHQCAPAFVPRPLDFARQGQLWGLWMEGVPGSAMAGIDCTPPILRSLAEMVTAIHTASRRDREQLDPGRRRRLIEEPLAAVAGFRADQTVAAKCAELGAAATGAWLDALPVIPQHGDLYPGNVLVERDKLHVVDWENFGDIDLPMFDLVVLLSCLPHPKGTDQAWEPAARSVIPSLVRTYGRKFHLNPGDITLLFPLALANWFYLHFKDHREKSIADIYAKIEQYFQNPEIWNRALLA